MGVMACKNVSLTTNRWTRGVNNAADIFVFYLYLMSLFFS